MKKTPWHKSVRESINQKTTSFNETVNQKFPKAATKTSKAFSYIKEVW